MSVTSPTSGLLELQLSASVSVTKIQNAQGQGWTGKDNIYLEFLESLQEATNYFQIIWGPSPQSAEFMPGGTEAKET